ncbi:MAG: carboxypeptidase M32 [Opitutales bacterium]|jgi:carboxypeptidase Taq
MDTYPDYLELVSRLKRLDRIGSIGSLISWDEQVNLPPGSSGLRSEQRAVFTEIAHREASHPEIGELIDKVEAIGGQLSPDQQAVVREARRDYDRLTRIPAEFAARKSKAQSLSFRAWIKARKDNDFAAFQPHLEEQLQFAREEAAIMQTEHPYNYWVDQFDPGMDCATIERLFGALQPELKSIVGTILDAPDQPDTSIFKGFPVEDQDLFLREVVTSMGFDFNRGRLDTAVHPFCGGHGQDTRMTTRYHEDNPLDSLSSSIHETGHALYEQGLPDEHAGTALGVAVGMAVHESQSRLWENQVGRSREFWKCWEPRYREIFGQQLKNVPSEALYRAINKVGLTPIRVDADEVTYNLHIMLRFELERRLFDGSLSTKDLPEAWNEASTRILGYTPANDAEGCMQDVHWSEGMFGYFPSYCLGNIVAGQLWYTLRDQLPGLDDQIATGNHQPLLQWLRDNVHSKGRRLYTLAFTREVTGKDLSTEYLVRYLKERYLPLYTAS